MGNDACLGELSCLTSGRHISDGETWSGSPAKHRDQPHPALANMTISSQQHGIKGIIVSLRNGLIFLIGFCTLNLISFAAIVPCVVVATALESVVHVAGSTALELIVFGALLGYILYIRIVFNVLTIAVI